MHGCPPPIRGQDEAPQLVAGALPLTSSNGGVTMPALGWIGLAAAAGLAYLALRLGLDWWVATKCPSPLIEECERRRQASLKRLAEQRVP